MSEPTRWRVIFADYKDLSEGMIYEKGKGPMAYSNMTSDFEVIAADKYESLRAESAALAKRVIEQNKLNSELILENSALKELVREALDDYIDPDYGDQNQWIDRAYALIKKEG